MNKKNRIIALLTDFGAGDAYAASLKGVIHSINPNAKIIDISHSVRPQDVKQAAFILQEIYPYFPKQTIYVAVVDPGVGSSRRAICVKTAKGYLIGPDNGLFDLVLAGESKYEVRCLVNHQYFLNRISATFHGRDIFAPVAAYLSRSEIFSKLGPILKTTQKLNFPVAKIRDRKISGEIIYIDHFGNTVSNISKKLFNKLNSKHRYTIQIRSIRIKQIKSFFSEGQKNKPMALWNSSNLLEIALRNGSAAKTFGIKIGHPISIQIS